MVPISQPARTEEEGDQLYRRRRVVVVLPAAIILACLRVLLDLVPPGDTLTYLSLATGVSGAIIWRRTSRAALTVLDWTVGDWSGRAVGRLAIGVAPSQPAPQETAAQRTRRVLTSIRWRICLRLRASRAASYVALGYCLTYVTGLAGPYTIVIAAAVALTARAWRYRIRPMPPEPEPAEETLEDIWHGDLAPAIGCAGAVMLAVEPLRTVDGWRADIELIRAKQTVSMLRAGAEKIASAYDVTPSQVGIEQLGSARRARLTIVQNSVLTSGKVTTGLGLDLETGVADLSTLIDGSRAGWQWYDPEYGTYMGWVFGSTGSGKSKTLDALLSSIMASGIAVLDLVDLKGGSSLPEWKAVAYRYGTDLPSALAGIERAIAVHEARSRWLDEHMMRQRTPAPDWPLYLLVIEEFAHLREIRGAIARAERIVTQGRATAVALVVATQASDLAGAFSGSNVFRTQLQAGNVLALRSDAGAARTGLGGMAGQIDLSVIPARQGGTGYLITPSSQRPILGRVDHVRDTQAVVDRCIAAVPGPLIDLAVARIEASWEEQAKQQQAAGSLADQALAEASVLLDRANTNSPRSPVRDKVLAWLREHPGPQSVRDMVTAGLGSDKGIREARDSLCKDGLVQLTPSAGQGSCQAVTQEAS